MLSDATCPSVEILRRSLDPDDPMTEPERRRIEAHVDQCQQGCKAAIEALLRGNTVATGPETIRPVRTPASADLQEMATVATNAPVPVLGSLTLPGYELLEEIGRGGM